MKKRLTNEEKLILEGILRKCNWNERIIIKRNKGLILNIYHEGRINMINTILL